MFGEGISSSVPCENPSILGEYYLPRCEAFRGRPKECAGVVTWDVLIPPGTTQEQLAANAVVSLAQIQALPTSCHEKTLRMTCASNFPRCVRAPLNPIVGINLPSFTCKSFCLEAKDQCAKVSQANLNCSLLTGSGEELFPLEGSTTNALGVDLYVPCHVPEFVPGGYRKRKSCPYPLSKTGDDEDVCKWGCPTPQFEVWEYKVHMGIITPICYLGFFLGVICFVSLSLHPLRRTFPKNVINFQVLASTLMVIGFLISHWVYGDGPPFRGVWCEDKHTPARGSTNSACAAQSFFLVVCNFSLVSWYLMVALFMLRAVLNIRIPRKKIFRWPLILFIHAICWCPGLIIWIVLMSTDSISSVGSFPCFVDADYWGTYLAEVVWWYPVTIMLMLGLAITAVSTIWTIKKTGKRGFRKQFRLIMFLLYNFVVNIWTCFYHYYVFARRSGYIKAGENWAICSATSLNECKFYGGVEFWLYLINGIISATPPLIVSLILLSDRDIWLWWRDFIRRVVLRQEVDDREEAIKRVRAVQAIMERSKSAVSATSQSASGWGADE